MPGRTSAADRVLPALAILAVALVLLAHWVALSQHGVDVPISDDWRMLRPGPHLLPDHLDLGWLLLPSNDTVFATGKLFDYLYFQTAFGLTRGDFALYQQITSLVAFVGCLGLIFRLLWWLELPTAWKVLGVLSSVYLLQADSYWGTMTIAYQQAIPLLAILFALVIVVAEKWNRARGVSLALATLAGGLSYISGAATLVALAVFLAIVVWIARALGISAPRAMPERIAWLLLPAFFAFGLQLLLTAQIEAPPGAVQRFAHPLEWQFWHFGAHQVARALGDRSMDASSALRSALLAIAVLALPAIAIGIAAYRAATVRSNSADLRFVMIAGGLLVVLIGYLAIVSVARPHLMIVRHDPAQFAMYAKSRFHYWWVGAWLPFALVSPVFLLGWLRTQVAESRWLATLKAWAPPLALGVVLLALQSSAQWDFSGYYAERGAYRQRKLNCIAREYSQRGAVNCAPKSFSLGEKNIRPHIDNAMTRGFHFAQTMRSRSERLKEWRKQKAARDRRKVR